MDASDDILNVVLHSNSEVLLSDASLFEQLSTFVNKLIVGDFERLVSLLYRLDINEEKLQYLLSAQARTNASDTIASLIIERQVQKIKSRRQHRRDNNHINGDEAW